jgi:putative tributyrin esterase
MFRTFEQSDPRLSPDGFTFLTVKSAALKQRADITLYASDPSNVGPDTPVVLLLNGVYGSHWAWSFSGGAHRTASRLVDSGDLPEVLLCMPSDGLWGDGSGFVPHRSSNVEQWIVDEVPAAALRAYGLAGAAPPLFIAGLSMGGFAALRLAGKYPERFAAASAHSALTRAVDLDSLIVESRSEWSTLPVDNEVIVALRSAMGALPPLRFDCGSDDVWIEDNRLLHRQLAESGISHRFEEYPGGHDWPYWQSGLERTLRFFAEVLRSSAEPHPKPDHGISL